MKIFIGGSQSIVNIKSWSLLITQLTFEFKNGYKFLIGDCKGVDEQVQTLYSKDNNRPVIVYCSGETCRCNKGGWKEVHVPADGLNGFEFYRQKDKAMITDADIGLMIWDGKSKGTRVNIKELLEQDKEVFLYYFANRIMAILRNTEDFKKFCDKYGLKYERKRKANQIRENKKR